MRLQERFVVWGFNFKLPGVDINPQLNYYLMMVDLDKKEPIVHYYFYKN